MGEITTVGIDLAKNVFQVHGVDANGHIVVRKAVRRAQVVRLFAALPRCLVGMEACATAHYWARAIAALGHAVRLMLPQYVMHRARELLIRQRTMLVNALRAHLAEFGIVAAQGIHRVDDLVAIVADEADTRVPAIARPVLRVVADQIAVVQSGIEGINARIVLWHRSSEASRRLASIPGVGPIVAATVAASVPDAPVFRCGREFAAWLGLVPRQSGTGGKTWLGRISRRGDGYVRRLLVTGALTALTRCKAVKALPWIDGMKARRKPRMVIAVALANNMARMTWAMMVRGTAYRAPAA